AADENRSDDTPEAIERRLELYERETAPLVDYYRSTRANVVGIHADRTVEEVFHEIEQALEEGQRHSKVEAGSSASPRPSSRAWRARARSSPRRSPWWRSSSSRASRCASSTASPTSTSRPEADIRPPRATRASRPRSASRRTRWSCTGSPTRIARGK